MSDALKVAEARLRLGDLPDGLDVVEELVQVHAWDGIVVRSGIVLHFKSAHLPRTICAKLVLRQGWFSRRPGSQGDFCQDCVVALVSRWVDGVW